MVAAGVGACLTACAALAGGCVLLAVALGNPTTGAGWEAQLPVDGPGEGTLRLAGADPQDLDPALTQDVGSAEYVYEIFSGLVTLDANLRVAPDLAKSWSISRDGLVYTFDLRPEVRFHDGSELTARDIRYAIERACDPATGSPTASTYLGDIVGCNQKLNGRAAEVEGLRVADDHTLELRIDSPKAYFLAKLTYPTSFALDRRNVESGSDWMTRANGSGPFRLARYAEGDELVLERNAHYYREPQARLGRVRFDLAAASAITRYENGELDATAVGVSDLARVTDSANPLHVEVRPAPPSLETSYLAFNVNRPPFDDQHVRQALNYAIDKELLTRVALRGAADPAWTILPPAMPGYDAAASPYKFDPRRARQLLSQAGYRSADSLPEITLVVPDSGWRPDPVTEAVIDQLRRQLGLDIVVQLADWETFQAELSHGHYQMFRLGWVADYVDPQNFLDVLFHSTSDLNHTGYSDAQTDELLERARGERDSQKRRRLYRLAEQRILEGAAWLPLYHGRDTWLVAPWVTGFELSAISRPRLQFVDLEPSG
jgi:ABC-type transport system substrate-binding protein